MFDEDCTTAYVLPPIVGKAELAALAQNANLQFCPAQLKVGVVATSTLDSAKIISDQLVAMVKGYKPGADELEKLRAKAVEAKALKDESDDLFSSAKARDATLFTAVESAATSHKQCTVLATDPVKECASQKADLDQAKADYKTFLPELVKKETSFRSAKRAYEIADGELQLKTSQYASATAPLFDLQNKLFDLNNQVMDLYRQYSPLEGATLI